ncbi:two-component system, OmpR family, alkaline phosphatase synthesis response regulator PhoP [Saccharicrinis carchari]|uniref:Two-component system, OmpR family, alkaline phosphatase synthesis response regulator PhoP n=1 Tax=Saccharicrinis carchari TaxID=1168039 RepID=A0A521DMH2_SACCC|nr:response regulator transcription factor [Saccharicrinis carchari]SMO72907.1 two-component system, OmpR family, alkaline phosphatase synthesis response regulator PhoP [Saccharicrinis carchari]
MEKILVVEDEPDMVMGLKDNLEYEGYEVDIASDGEDGLAKILTSRYDLVLLDVMLPKLSGFDVCKRARKSKIQTPIIFLSAKGEELDKVIGLESGADDYITKPFSLRELSARIKAVIRRTSAHDSPGDGERAQIGRLTVDFNNYTAYEGKQQVKMSLKEHEILHHLWHNKNRTVSRDSLLDAVWGFNYQPTTRTIDNFILKLRNKVEHNPNNPAILLTVHGVGYKLVLG